MINNENITYERYLTERCAIPIEALHAALTLCLYDVQSSLAICFGISEYGSMHRTIFDPPTEWVKQIDKSLKILAKSLGYDEREFENPGVTANLPKFVQKGIVHRAYQETESTDPVIAAFIQLAVHDIALGQLGGPNDNHRHDRSEIINNMRDLRKQLVTLE